MNTISALEQQFPLSPKKFWKKIISKIISFLFLGAFFSFLISMFSLAVISGSDITGPFLLQNFIIGVVIFFLLSMGIYAIYVGAYIKRYYYSADKDFITIKKGVFAPTEIHVQYTKIQDVYVDQDILDRILGIFDVHIASATMGSAIEAHIDGVEAQHAEGLKNLLLDSIRAGGVGSPTSNSGATATSPSEPVKINLTEKFSSENYPIESRWVYTSIFRYFFSSIIFSLVIVSNILKGEGALDRELFIFLVITFVFMLFGFIYTILWKRTYRFEFTPEYIFTHEGVIGRKEAHTPYNTIQDVIVQQGVIDRVFGLYSVMIQNAANNGMAYSGRRGVPLFQGVTIPGQTKERAERIANSLKSTLGATNSSRTGL